MLITLYDGDQPAALIDDGQAEDLAYLLDRGLTREPKVEPPPADTTVKTEGGDGTEPQQPEVAVAETQAAAQPEKTPEATVAVEPVAMQQQASAPAAPVVAVTPAATAPPTAKDPRQKQPR